MRSCLKRRRRRPGRSYTGCAASIQHPNQPDPLQLVPAGATTHSTSVGGRNAPNQRNTRSRRWNRKLGALRRYLRGWASHNNGIYKQKKTELQNTISSLDIDAEVRDLTEIERELLDLSRDHLTKLLREEEVRFFLIIKSRLFTKRLSRSVSFFKDF